MHFATIKDCAEFCVYWYECGCTFTSEEVKLEDLQELQEAIEDLSNATFKDIAELSPEQIKACSWCYNNYKGFAVE